MSDTQENNSPRKSNEHTGDHAVEDLRIQLQAIYGTKANLRGIDAEDRQGTGLGLINHMLHQVQEIGEINSTLGDATYFQVSGDLSHKILTAYLTLDDLRAYETTATNRLRATFQVLMEAIVSGICKEFKQKFGAKDFNEFSKMLDRMLDGLDLAELEQEAKRKIADFNMEVRLS